MELSTERQQKRRLSDSNTDYMTHKDDGKGSHPQAGHEMAEIQPTHVRHAGHSVAMFRDKFWLSFGLTIPVVFWSTDVQHWLGYTAPSFPGSKFIPPILGTVVFIYGGLVFIRGAWSELDDPHQLGDHSRFWYFARGDIRHLRDRSLVGTRLTDYDHGPRPLARNASHFSGSGGAQRTRGAAPGHRRTP